MLPPQRIHLDVEDPPADPKRTRRLLVRIAQTNHRIDVLVRSEVAMILKVVNVERGRDASSNGDTSVR
jgi:hypothetical protein